MRISDWSSDVCSSDLVGHGLPLEATIIAREAGRRLVAPGTGGWGLLQERLALAMPAPNRRPMADLRLLQWPAAVRAGGTATAVRAHLLQEIARCARRGQDVAYGGAARGGCGFAE